MFHGCGLAARHSQDRIGRVKGDLGNRVQRASDMGRQRRLHYVRSESAIPPIIYRESGHTRAAAKGHRPTSP